MLSVTAESTSARLVKALVPCAGVPDEALLMAVSWMCTNSPSTNIQVSGSLIHVGVCNEEAICTGHREKNVGSMLPNNNI